MGHRHKVAGKWTTTDAEPAQFTPAEVAALKTLLIAHGQGGTTPVPNPPPGPGDITAPTVSGVSSSVTTTTATIVATTDEAATVQVEYSTTGMWPGTLTAATSSGTSHSRTLTGLTPGQTYVYRIRATDTAGNLRLDGNRTFTTTSAPTLPGAPTGLTATGGNTQVALAWTAPASNGGSAITGYRVYRNGASLIVLGVVTSYNNTGLTNGLTYSYTVAAITAVGEGPQSASAFATPSAGGDINPPIISNIAVSGITTTTAQVSWSLNEPGNGQVEYGTTIAYGQTTTLEAGYLTGHNQTISGLTPGATYHFRVRSADAANNVAYSSDRTVTTLNTPPPPPPPDPPPSTLAYGTGISGDSRNNQRIGNGGYKLSYRFVAIASSTPSTIRVQERGGPAGSGYSEGNGGTMRCTVQTDSGGMPSGTVLGTATWSPGNPAGNWEVWTSHAFSGASALTSGTTYHLVIENTHASQLTNWISINTLFTYNGTRTNPRFPAFPDTFAALYGQTLALKTNDLPIFDLTYASGAHDGQGYIGILLGTSIGNISGTNEQVRQRFTVTGGTRNVTAASVKLKRITGSGALTMTLETGAGSLIEAVVIPASSIPVGQMPVGNGQGDLGGNTWAEAVFTATRTLTNGSTYNLRLSCPSGTQYICVPLQEGTDKGLLSRRFTDGDAQRTINGGSSWENLYPWEPVDLQMFFEVVP